MSEEIDKPERSAGVQVLIGLAWAIGGLFLLVMITMPPLMGQKREGDFAKATQNTKSIGYALFNFENDFGCYPNDETVKDLDEGAILSSAGGSNYYFSQLIAGGYCDQESPFYAAIGNTVEPDNDKSTPDQILKAGEVGYVYVVWDSSRDLPGDAPLMFAYLGKDKKATWTSSGLFFSKSKIMVLRVDMAVETLKAERDGTVMLNGKDYFDWSQPHWGGQKPKIVWPE